VCNIYIAFILIALALPGLLMTYNDAADVLATFQKYIRLNEEFISSVETDMERTVIYQNLKKEVEAYHEGP